MSINSRFVWINTVENLYEKMFPCKPTSKEKVLSEPINEIIRQFKLNMDDMGAERRNLANKIMLLSEKKLEYYRTSRFGFIKQIFSSLRNFVRFGVCKSSGQLGVELAEKFLAKFQDINALPVKKVYVKSTPSLIQNDNLATNSEEFKNEECSSFDLAVEKEDDESLESSLLQEEEVDEENEFEMGVSEEKDEEVKNSEEQEITPSAQTTESETLDLEKVSTHTEEEEVEEDQDQTLSQDSKQLESPTEDLSNKETEITAQKIEENTEDGEDQNDNKNSELEASLEPYVAEIIHYCEAAKDNSYNVAKDAYSQAQSMYSRAVNVYSQAKGACSQAVGMYSQAKNWLWPKTESSMKKNEQLAIPQAQVSKPESDNLAEKSSFKKGEEKPQEKEMASEGELLNQDDKNSQSNEKKEKQPENSLYAYLISPVRKTANTLYNGYLALPSLTKKKPEEKEAISPAEPLKIADKEEVKSEQVEQLNEVLADEDKINNLLVIDTVYEEKAPQAATNELEVSQHQTLLSAYLPNSINNLYTKLTSYFENQPVSEEPKEITDIENQLKEMKEAEEEAIAKLFHEELNIDLSLLKEENGEIEEAAAQYIKEKAEKDKKAEEARKNQETAIKELLSIDEKGLLEESQNTTDKAAIFLEEYNKKEKEATRLWKENAMKKAIETAILKANKNAHQELKKDLIESPASLAGFLFYIQALMSKGELEAVYSLLKGLYKENLNLLEEEKIDDESVSPGENNDTENNTPDEDDNSLAKTTPKEEKGTDIQEVAESILEEPVQEKLSLYQKKKKELETAIDNYKKALSKHNDEEIEAEKEYLKVLKDEYWSSDQFIQDEIEEQKRKNEELESDNSHGNQDEKEMKANDEKSDASWSAFVGNQISQSFHSLNNGFTSLISNLWNKK